MKSLNSDEELWVAEELEVREEYGCFCVTVCFCFSVCFSVCFKACFGL